MEYGIDSPLHWGGIEKLSNLQRSHSHWVARLDPLGSLAPELLSPLMSLLLLCPCSSQSWPPRLFHFQWTRHLPIYDHRPPMYHLTFVQVSARVWPARVTMSPCVVAWGRSFRFRMFSTGRQTLGAPWTWKRNAAGSVSRMKLQVGPKASTALPVSSGQFLVSRGLHQSSYMTWASNSGKTSQSATALSWEAGELQLIPSLLLPTQLECKKHHFSFLTYF